MKLIKILSISCRNYWTFKRLLPVFCFSFIYILIFLAPLKEIAKNYGEAIPWSIWSLLFVDEFFIGVTLTSVLLLFSTLPFNDSMQTWIILKVGYRKWGLAQMLYILCSSLLYTLIHFVMSVLYLIPYGLPLNTWGRLLKNIVRGTYPVKNIHSYIVIDPIALGYYSPLRAIVQVFIMLMLISALLGMIIFVFNLLIPRLGYVISGGLIVMSFFFTHASRLWIYFLSPLNWVNIYQLRHAPYSSLPTFSQVLLAAIILIAVLGLIGYVYLKRKEFYQK